MLRAGISIKGIAHVGKLVKPYKCVAVGAVFNRDFRHLSRLKTAPTGEFNLFTDMSQRCIHTVR